jgi:hypothetical protein
LARCLDPTEVPIRLPSLSVVHLESQMRTEGSTAGRFTTRAILRRMPQGSQ